MSGERNLELEDELKSAVDGSQKLSLMAPILGWISGVAFIAGSYLLASS